MAHLEFDWRNHSRKKVDRHSYPCEWIGHLGLKKMLVDTNTGLEGEFQTIELVYKHDGMCGNSWQNSIP